jgi:hypothetical protein
MYIKSRSQLIANRIKICILQKLEKDGKQKFLDWFRSVYLNDKWCNFNHVSVKSPGIEPTQQHIEGCNNGIKTVLGIN